MDSEGLVRGAWASISSGDLESLANSLDANARWRAVEDGPWNCAGKATILQRMQDRGVAGALAGQIDSLVSVGDRVVVGFRPEQHSPDGWRLDNGVRYVVVTVRDDLVVEIKGCLNRQVALDYAGSAA